jgi:nucleoside-diphosphate-sugar epimerase
MQSVLITGANGFIGSHLCDAFLDNGYAVHGLVRSTSDLRFLQHAGVKKVYGDLRRPEEISFPESVDVIVHAAALVSDNATLEQCRTNIYGITESLVTEARRRYPRLARFIYISTALTLGYCADNISESAPGKSAAYVPYNRMKIETERMLTQMHQETGFPVVILRPADVYGPRDRTSCELMLQAAEKGVPLRVGTGKKKFGLCSPANLCLAALAAARQPQATGKAYTVANRVSPTWKEFFDALQKGVGRPQRYYVPVSVSFVAGAFGELARRIVPGYQPPLNFYRIRRITSQTTYDLSRTLTDLGFAPDDDYATQFASIVEWYKNEKARSARAAGA